MNKKELSVLLGLVFTIVFSICSENIKAAETVKANTLRLHIIANSDTQTDQNIKMMIRDNILQTEKLIMPQAEDFGEQLSML